MEGMGAGELFERLRDELSLSRVCGGGSSRVDVGDSNVSRPGLLLAGFEDGFRANRVQLLGEQEVAFLRSLDEKALEAAVARICSADVPCVIVADGARPPDELLADAERCGLPVFTTPMAADTVARELTSYLDDALAPQTTVQGTLVDVYGVGLLFTGKSGIGKSECGLDLVANGHRLVADDIVRVMRTRRGYLIGFGDELLEHHMEIRGVGIIDVASMYGARALRQRKRIEVKVELVAWSELGDYERLGFEDRTFEMLGVEVPMVTLPLVLGKNITVISEVIALKYLLKLRGINAALDFDKRQREAMARNAGILGARRGDDE